mmetsp:Transcript_78265/g.162555  ORF Transcript_78265/g.162555 Transcript_78265/m.162555 type:complete len:295 (+) Transcript_78265:103-987(+)
MASPPSHSGPREFSVMVKNLPRKFTSKDLLKAFECHVTREHISMVSVPWDGKNPCNLGFAFVNFVNLDVACRAWTDLDGKVLTTPTSSKALRLQPARLQGLVENLRHCCSALEPDVDPRHFPIILINGSPVSFRSASGILRELDQTAPQVDASVLSEALKPFADAAADLDMPSEATHIQEECPPAASAGSASTAGQFCPDGDPGATEVAPPSKLHDAMMGSDLGGRLPEARHRTGISSHSRCAISTVRRPTMAGTSLLAERNAWAEVAPLLSSVLRLSETLWQNPAYMPSVIWQ